MISPIQKVHVPDPDKVSHIRQLEAEAIHVLREVAE
ncbi:sulfate adenylyltransferase small subunit, partial [bacterium]|nr:sulfate adenylyltransferase small subunit [bacterium]